jgi:hypothetical protein
MANYTNTTNVAQFLQRSLSANEIAALNNFILNAVDKWIDRKLESHFADEQPSTRYFDGGAHSIDIDPVQAITAVGSLNNDGSASYSYTENTEVVFEPVNDTVKREIVYRGRGRRFPRGSRRMAVTGRFTEYDYTTNAVPYDIVMAATRLAAGILNAGKLAGQGENLQQESLEGHEIRYNITNNSINTLADGDPILQGMIAERRQIYVFSDDDQGDDDFDW